MFKSWIKIICLIVAVVTLTTSIGFLSNGFTDTNVKGWFSTEVNEDNLIKVKNYNENSLKDTSAGLKVTKYDDGSFALNGKHKDDDSSENGIYDSAFVNVNLEQGKTYVISTGNDRCDTEKFGLYFMMDGVRTAVGAKDVTIGPVAEDTVITIGYFVKNNETFFNLFGSTKITPILVEQGQSVEFYQ